MTVCCFCVIFFKQKTAYEMRISDWSSDVCSSDLLLRALAVAMDQRVMRPGDRRARAEQDQRVEQRQAEGVDHLQPDRRPCATNDLGAGRKQRRTEIGPEPCDEEHHFQIGRAS